MSEATAVFCALCDYEGPSHEVGSHQCIVGTLAKIKDAEADANQLAEVAQAFLGPCAWLGCEEFACWSGKEYGEWQEWCPEHRPCKASDMFNEEAAAAVTALRKHREQNADD